jgi:hypothetical protein
VANGIQDRQNHLSVSGGEEEIAVAAPGTDLMLALALDSMAITS